MVTTIIISVLSSIGTIFTIWWTCIQIKTHYEVLSSNNFKKGKADKTIGDRTKPVFRIFNHYFIKKLPMKKAEKDAKKLARMIILDDFYPSIIVGIGRGGAIFGSLLSYKLYQVPIFCLDRAYSWQKERKDSIPFDFEIPARFLRKVLLVSGEVHSANTMRLFKSYLESMGAADVKTCTFYLEDCSTVDIDYNLTHGSGIPFMPWQGKDYLRDSINSKNYNALEAKRSTITSKKNKTIYILRHGETAQNAADIFIGSATDEAKLTPNGIEQAMSAGQIIRNSLGDRKVLIHCSPQFRCKETADYVAQYVNSDIVFCDDLKERCYGVWENQARSSLVERKEYKQYLANPLKSTPENAETMQDTICRATHFLDREILSNDTVNSHIIVTHKTTGRILLAFLMNIPYSKFRSIVLENDSIVKIEINGKDFDCSYLR